jgi:hypothetical protein
MGLQRQRTAMRHFKILAQMAPSSFRFNSQAGVWSLDPHIARPDDAIEFLTNAIYRNASQDPEATPESILSCRRQLARALMQQERYLDAHRELLTILQMTPHDFGIAYLLEEVSRHVLEVRPDLPYRPISYLKVSPLSIYIYHCLPH